MEPTIYLYFNGDCFEAMSFYAETLGGEITGVYRNGDAPDPESRMPGGDELVMNMNMRLGSANIMASDAPGEWYNKPQGFSISIAPESVEAFDTIFDTLSKDAQSVSMQPTETFWAERFAMFTDQYGTPWMLNFTGSKAMG
ncbi:VOC family protein [Oricola sp.]|uniref:VOC family protein n=1 Tax=Oricola sp. TaxID=1979950 RepID=UPI0025CF8A7C|nr:VOC family protein [Oricola sp.]MCI5077700.1 VOC family protein [Oricola sp.]